MGGERGRGWRKGGEVGRVGSELRGARSED